MSDVETMQLQIRLRDITEENESLREEIERLRKALKLAKEWGVDSDMGGKNPVSAALRHWIKGGMRGPLTTEQKENEG